MKKYIIIAATAILAAACSSSTTLQGSVPQEVSEVIATVAGQDYTLAVTNGQFKGKLPVDVTTFSGFKAGDINRSFISDGSTITIDVEEDGDVEFSSNDKNSVQSRLNEVHEWYQDFMEDYQEKSRDGEMTAELDAELTESYVEKLKGYAAANKDNVIAGGAIALLEGQIEDAELEKIIAGVDPKILEADKDLQRIKAGIEKRKGTQSGAMFTDFEVTQPDGSIAKLSDYVGKGKYILVDFWASWCGPCKREIPNIKAAYEKYKGDKFDVLSVAVWDKPEDTVKAAAEHGVVWNQIINAQRIPTDIYGIEGIPHLILFGPDGSIVKRGEGLRGEGLEKTLSELLK